MIAVSLNISGGVRQKINAYGDNHGASLVMSYLGTVASLNQQHSAKVDSIGPPNEVVISCLS